MTVIDLGERRAGPDDEPPPPRPTHRREWAVAATVALLLLVLGAAAPARTVFRPLGRIHATPGDLLLVAGDRMYAAKTQETPATLDAYDVRDGSRLWSVPYPGGVSAGGFGGGTLWMGGGLLVVPSEEEAPGEAAVDPDTGRVVWHVELVYGDVEGGRYKLVGDAAGTWVSLMDATTGAMMWSRTLSGCAVNPLSDGPDVFALRCDHSAELRLVDARTDAVRATRDMSALVSEVDDAGDLDYNLVVAGATLGVVHGRSIIGLRLDDLGDRWPAVAVPADSYPYPCMAGYICVAVGIEQVELDAATGRIVGSVPLDESGPGVPPADVSGGARQDRPPAAVLAPFYPLAPLTTGRDTVLTMADGQDEMPIFAGGYPTWVFRAVRDPRAPTGYRFRPIGKLDGVLASACFGTGRYLACATATGELTFYAVSSWP